MILLIKYDYNWFCMVCRCGVRSSKLKLWVLLRFLGKNILGCKIKFI